MDVEWKEWVVPGLRETLQIEAPIATCGHCGFSGRLVGTWLVEDGRLVFRADLDPLANRGPDYTSCCESDPVVQFQRITVDDEPLTDEQVATLRASAGSDEAWREEEARDRAYAEKLHRALGEPKD
jgi:hypothetical protein